MTNEEKLQKIIAAYTPLDYTKINLKRAIKDNYIAAEFKDNFCADICIAWRNINPTQLRNDMFVKLKTGEDILKILKYVLL
ncbi:MULTISPECIES: hypothetical protein [unclassified Chryseobacterium]|uniref:hypothetical protein n=1 Tax=unclassified Chryseobacterium TaxID=2593645 RepID=UPI00100AE22A|nr:MULTISPECIES: hypothetical protein [unclassified Chryseobacterium]RXM52936.1 hypothetical protein BOQ64_00535 [Chryseobacterium sp. CH25]RXM65866.1 hypothetical protein BOQ60_08970 [Chryseobacterium sp. CH1]